MVPALRGSCSDVGAAVALDIILYGWSMCRQVDLTWVCFVSVSESICGYCLFDRMLMRSRIEVCIPRTFRVHRLMGVGMYRLGSGLVREVGCPGVLSVEVVLVLVLRRNSVLATGGAARTDVGGVGCGLCGVFRVFGLWGVRVVRMEFGTV